MIWIKKNFWVVNKTLRPGDAALDIGANLGLVSLKMLAKVGESGQVIAFEPQSRMVAFIEKSIALNNIKNMHVHRVGVGDEKGTLKLSISEKNAGAASFTLNTGGLSEEAKVITLDDFAQENDLSQVRLIKIDVEGFESRVISGGKNFFTSVKPHVVLFEENQRGETHPPSVPILQTYGYDIFALPKALFSIKLNEYRSGEDANDFVAVHKEAPADLRRRLGI